MEKITENDLIKKILSNHYKIVVENKNNNEFYFKRLFEKEQFSLKIKEGQTLTDAFFQKYEHPFEDFDISDFFKKICISLIPYDKKQKSINCIVIKNNDIYSLLSSRLADKEIYKKKNSQFSPGDYKFSYVGIDHSIGKQNNDITTNDLLSIAEDIGVKFDTMNIKDLEEIFEVLFLNSNSWEENDDIENCNIYYCIDD